MAEGSSSTFLARDTEVPIPPARWGGGDEVSQAVRTLVRDRLVMNSESDRIIGHLYCARPARSWTGVGKCGQAIKGAGWMSWHREATKDVAACDKPGEAGKRALIPGSLNEETRRHDLPSSHAEFIGVRKRTRGTETSHYPQEKKETSIPSVAASERGTSPNRDSSRGCGSTEGLQNRP